MAKLKRSIEKLSGKIGDRVSPQELNLMTLISQFPISKTSKLTTVVYLLYWLRIRLRLCGVSPR